MQLTFFDNPPAIESATGDAKLAAKLRQLAEKLDKAIEDKGRPMTQNPTPKRMREYASRLHDAANLARTQKGLYALADLQEQGTCPPVLADLKTKKDVEALVWTRGRSEGYYDYSDSGEYGDTSPAGLALQALIDGTPEQRAEAQRLAEIAQLEGKARMNVGSIPGFFPTPAGIADEMVLMARVEPGMLVLEPSAGSGAIADAIRRGCPQAHIAVIEWNYGLRDLLKLKGYDVIGDDFMEYYTTQNGVDGWHRIIMNPPFEQQQDIDHVRHAYDCLKAGGRLVAIMGESGFFRDNRKSREFREWLDELGYDEVRLESGAFAESGTQVAARIIVLDK